jgi:hypothetical protein
VAETLEELIIRIGADVTDLKKGMKEAGKDIQGLERDTQKSTDKMDASFGSMATGIKSRVAVMTAALAGAVAAVGAVGFALKSLADHAANTLNALGDLSQRTGIAVEQLDALRQVAAQSGVDFETLQQAIAGWTQKTAELVDPMSQVTLALRAMGVDARDSQGRLRTLADLLPDLADRFAGYRDGVEKARLASVLFGEEAGPRMLALLNQGRAAVEAQTASVTAHGVATQQQADLARQYRVAQTQASEAVSRLATELGVRLLPIMRDAANVITTLISLLPRTATSAEVLAQQIDHLTQKNEADNAALERLRATLGTLVGASRAARERMIADSEARLAANQRELQQLLRIQELQRNAAPVVTPPGGSPTDGTTPPDPAALARSAQQALQEGQAQLALFQEQVLGTRNVIMSMGDAWSQTAQGIMGWTQQLNLSFVSHAELMEQTQERIRSAYATTAEQRRALVQFEMQLNKLQTQGMFDVANAAASLIQQLWPQQKNAAIAAAVINTAVGVTKALSSGIPPWNIALAALTAAAGAVQIATIRSSNPGGGASLSMPSASAPAVPNVAASGGGGAGAAGGGGAAAPAAAASAPPGWTLTIKGLDPAAIFTGQTVDGIIDRINEAVQNGATLISTRNMRF